MRDLKKYGIDLSKNIREGENVSDVIAGNEILTLRICILENEIIIRHAKLRNYDKQTVKHLKITTERSKP